MRQDLTIEIYVSCEPGSLSVQSYSDYGTQTLAQAIAEAEAFLAQCRALEAHIAEHGLGERPQPPTHAPNQHIGQVAAEAWERVMAVPLDQFRSLAK